LDTLYDIRIDTEQGLCAMIEDLLGTDPQSSSGALDEEDGVMITGFSAEGEK